MEIKNERDNVIIINKKLNKTIKQFKSDLKNSDNYEITEYEIKAKRDNEADSNINLNTNIKIKENNWKKLLISYLKNDRYKKSNDFNLDNSYVLKLIPTIEILI